MTYLIIVLGAGVVLVFAGAALARSADGIIRQRSGPDRPRCEAVDVPAMRGGWLGTRRSWSLLILVVNAAALWVLYAHSGGR